MNVNQYCVSTGIKKAIFSFFFFFFPEEMNMSKKNECLSEILPGDLVLHFPVGAHQKTPWALGLWPNVNITSKHLSRLLERTVLCIKNTAAVAEAKRFGF